MRARISQVFSQDFFIMQPMVMYRYTPNGVYLPDFDLSTCTVIVATIISQSNLMSSTKSTLIQYFNGYTQT